MDTADVGKFVQVKPQGIEPYPRSGHCFATDGINLFMYGGYNTEYRESNPGHEDVVTENHIFTEMWCFNLSTETWREVETVGEKPTATASMSMIMDTTFMPMIMDTSDHMLLLYGGSGYPWGQNVNADLIAFLLKEKRWKPLECAGDCPDGKYGQIHVFDLDAKKWTIEDTLRCPKHGYPKQRKYHGWVQWQKEVYICGGHNNKVALRDVWKLELPNLQWTRLPTTIPVDTFFHTAAITPTKCLYIFGGITDLEDRPRTNAIFRLWLAIPPLLDLALKKVLSLLPDRNVKTIARLKGLGVPPQVMDKLRHVE